MNEPISNKSANGQGAINDFKQISEAALANFGGSMEEITNKVVESTAELSGKTMSTIKKYPLHTALAAGALGFIVGALVARNK